MKHEISIPEGCKVLSVETTDNMVVIKIDKDEPKFKENDIISTSFAGLGDISIYRSNHDNDLCNVKVRLNVETDNMETNTKTFKMHMRLATDEEKQLLFDKLEEKCLMFDGENVVRWRAEPDNIYYGVDSDGVMNDEESCDVLDDIRYKNGNYFPTYKMAESFQKQYIELLNNFHKNL